jgi:small conductance mechanosensitive channel
MESGVGGQLIDVIATYGLRVIGGIVLLILGWMLANWIAKITKRQLEKTDKVDDTLTGFFSNLVKYVVLALVGIAVLNQFGVQTTSLIAIFGAAGLAIGLALQGTLSDIAAGVMLLIFRPFNVGQYIEAGGKAGTVKELSLFTTELATPDNVQVILPNSSVWGAAVTNYSHHETRRVDWTIGISYDDDIGKAFEAARRVISADDRILAEPEPDVMVSELADSSVNITIRVWVKSGNYWPVKFDLSRKFKEEFDSSSLVIPFPQQDVHMIQKSG